MWDLGYFIAQPLGAWLYNTGGFVLNFGSAVCIYSLACFIGVVRLWGFKEKINKCDLTIKGKLIYSLKGNDQKKYTLELKALKARKSVGLV